MIQATIKKMEADIREDEMRSLELASIQRRKRRASILMGVYARTDAAVRRAVAKTGESISLDLSSICSQALNEIFESDMYEIKIEGVEKKKSFEYSLELIKDGNSLGNPLDSSGGGTCDIISTCLRFICWKMSEQSGNQVRDMFILDEPFKNLSPRYMPNACLFFHNLAESLQLKVLMVTHLGEFILHADNVISVTSGKEGSCVHCNQN